ncbi:MAG: hypothetical protein ACRD3B_04105 [Candidatus Sulfotelmatobacter sp.]
MTGSAVVTAPQIPVQFAAVMSYPGFVAMDIAAQAGIGRERRRNSHSHQQQNPSYRAFHILSAPSQAVDVNTCCGAKLLQTGRAAEAVRVLQGAARVKAAPFQG